MLKSHFNLNKDDDAPEEQEEKKPKPRKSREVPLEEQAPEHILEEEHLELMMMEEERVTYPERRLNRSEVSVRLSMLGKTAEGDGYTYLKAAITKLNLTEISAIVSFKHLQFLDVSNNNLRLKNLQVVTQLPFLVLIQADNNVLHSALLNRMKYLQVIIMNNNFIASVHELYQPELSTLELANNRLHTISFMNRMPNIRCLDFRKNYIDDISELDLQKLDSLYLADNKIKSLVGIERLVNLRILHLRHNPIRLLTGFDECMTKLEYLNLRSCRVSTLIQVKKLRVLPALETLIMKGCPFMGGTGEEEPGAGEEDDAELRVEMLAALPRLKRINKTVVTPEESTEAKELMMTWLEEGEKDEEEMVEEHGEEEMHNED